MYRKRKQGIEIGFIQDPYYKWTFPKGHIEPGEEIVQTAVRESCEEMGLKKLIPIEQLGQIETWFIDRHVKKGEMIHKFTDLFLLQAEANAQAVPQRSEKIRAVRWVPIDKAIGFSSYENVVPVLKKAIDILKAQTSYDRENISRRRGSRQWQGTAPRISNRKPAS